MNFKDLTKANIKRCEKSYGHSIDDWSLTDWGCAIAGEVGELCNLIKKKKQGREVPYQDIFNELADVIIYADLLATKLEVDIDEIVKNKFNKTSDKINSNIKIK